MVGKLESYLNENSSKGSMEFLLIYFAGCFAGASLTTIRNSRNFEYSSTGASGSVFGCLFSYIILRPRIIALYLPFIGGVENQFFGLICMAGFTLYYLKTDNQLINHEVHFFGSIGGVAATLLLFHGIVL